MANELVQWSKEGQGVNRGHSTPTRHDQKVISRSQHSKNADTAK